MRTRRLLAALCAAFIALSVNSGRAAASQQAETLAPGTLVLSVGSRPVFWREIRFWLNYLGKHYKDTHLLNGPDLREFLLSTAIAYTCNDTAIEEQAAKLGIHLLEADLAQMAKTRQDDIDIYGGRAEYLRIVESMYGSEEQYEYLTKIDYLGSYVFNRLYGPDGGKCTDACVSAYVAQAGLINARYIFFSNRDVARNEVSALKRRQNRALLRNMLRRLDASPDPQTVFVALAAKYHAAPALANTLDSPLFARSSKGAEFSAAYDQLADHEYSRIVETSDGYYIILRMPIAPDMKVGTADKNLRYWAAYEYLYKKQIADWCGELSITYDDAYRRIDVEGSLK